MNKCGALSGSCLCGAVTYQSSQDHSEMWKCHCQPCRKASSVAYATWIRGHPHSFSWSSGEELITLHRSSPTMLRAFCSCCGSVLPAYNERDKCIFLPASGIDTEHALVFTADRYIQQVPDWHSLYEPLPGSAAVSSRGSLEASSQGDQPGRDCQQHGSCLCGDLSYRISGEFDAIRACHCSRCRRRSGSAYFAALPVNISELQLQGDEREITSYFLPGSQYYAYSFCRRCGSLAPAVFPNGKRGVVAAGTLDSSPPVYLNYHIYYASRASWMSLPDSATCFEEAPSMIEVK